MVISSTHNPHVKRLRLLRQKRTRVKERRMLVKGRDELLAALDGGARPVAAYYSPDLVSDADAEEILTRLAALGVESHALGRRVFEKVTYRQSPDGWLAVFPSVETSLAGLTLGSSPLILVCDGVEKPGNLGAMLRTADAVGASVVIATSSITDWGNPNIIRASKGTLFAIPVVEAEARAVLAWLREHDIAVVAAAPRARLTYTSRDLTGGVAIVVGSERYGVGELWTNHADATVQIPMSGVANSLNVAASAAILLYEAARQRARDRDPHPTI
jgi:TrmH family RNA methyltransferase